MFALNLRPLAQVPVSSFVYSNATLSSTQTLYVDLSQPWPSEKQSDDYIWTFATNPSVSRVTFFPYLWTAGGHRLRNFRRPDSLSAAVIRACLSQTCHSATLRGMRIHRQWSRVAIARRSLTNYSQQTRMVKHCTHRTTVPL